MRVWSNVTRVILGCVAATALVVGTSWATGSGGTVSACVHSKGGGL